ncbi:hypothetical protein D3870_21090 [Noviherbaspirillum cavernae]|uniref:Uncharacterized protein n=1 Tax=Noviherbaspirillum cavernae TaxID=2320862 RepID=A0A418WVZ9_9BURK|nr:hypothetical protein D3870_21090 [Noviherbaspirillum cavernae]
MSGRLSPPCFGKLRRIQDGIKDASFISQVLDGNVTNNDMAPFIRVPQEFIFTGTGPRCSEMPGQADTGLRLFATRQQGGDREVLRLTTKHHGRPGNDLAKLEFEDWRDMGLIDLTGKFDKVTQKAVHAPRGAIQHAGCIENF